MNQTRYVLSFEIFQSDVLEENQVLLPQNDKNGTIIGLNFGTLFRCSHEIVDPLSIPR